MWNNGKFKQSFIYYVDRNILNGTMEIHVTKNFVEY